MIQFTTVTLVSHTHNRYDPADSVFSCTPSPQVSGISSELIIWFVLVARLETIHRFLYIDLFVIIPVAVASNITAFRSPSMLTSFVSGSHSTLPENTPKAADCELGVEEGLDEYHRADCDQRGYSDLRLYLGSQAALVRLSVILPSLSDEFAGILNPT
jgi:hypothetical protein